MPASSERARVSRIARGVALTASVFFALAAAWGSFGMLLGGHIGAGHSAVAMMAERIVEWKTPYPSFGWYAPTAPTKGDYYCHHPFGMYWLEVPLLWLFGHRDFVVPLPAVLMSAATPPLLFGIGRRIGGAAAGAVAAAAFVVVPICLGFASFNNLEVMCIFGCALTFWGHLAYQESGRARHLAAALAGVLVTTSSDWVGWLVLAPLLGFGLLRAWVLPRGATPRFVERRYGRFWALATSLAIAMLALWVAFFVKADKLADWLGASDARGGGDASSLAQVLEGRRAWIDVSFTPLAIALGKLALPVAVVRLLVRRRDEEILSLAMLFGASVQYVVFKRGADVHTFWPHYFGAYYALALAQLAATVGDLARFARGRVSMPAFDPSAVTLVVGLVPSLVMLPDALRGLVYARETGGRYNDNGRIIRSHADMITVLRERVLPGLPAGASFDAHGSATWGWEHQWATASPFRNVSGAPVVPGSGSHPFWIGRASGMRAEELERNVAAGHARIWGDIIVVDQREPPAPLDAYAIEEREPNLLEWFFRGGVEPVRTTSATPDPWLTWEWRAHLGQPTTPPPADAPPEDLDALRVRHNAALAAGDDARANELRQRIERLLDRSAATRFDEGIGLIGVLRVGGVQPRIEIVFSADGPTQADVTFTVKSVVEARSPTSLVPPDRIERDMAYPPSLPSKLWKRGFLYSVPVVLRHRVGRERYFGMFTSRGGGAPPRRLDGRATTDLLVER